MATHPVFLPGESHGQRSLSGYSTQGYKESDTTEVTERAHTRVYSFSETEMTHDVFHKNKLFFRKFEDIEGF